MLCLCQSSEKRSCMGNYGNTWKKETEPLMNRSRSLQSIVGKKQNNELLIMIGQIKGRRTKIKEWDTLRGWASYCHETSSHTYEKTYSPCEYSRRIERFHSSLNDVLNKTTINKFIYTLFLTSVWFTLRRSSMFEQAHADIAMVERPRTHKMWNISADVRHDHAHENPMTHRSFTQNVFVNHDNTGI